MHFNPRHSMLPRHSLIARNSFIPQDSLFENILSPQWQGDEANEQLFCPRVDIQETADHYLLSAELPGVDKQALSVTLENGVLTLAADIRRQSSGDGMLIHQERHYGKFMRSFNLGADIKEAEIDAELKDGILTLTAPKVFVEESKLQRVMIH